jgi:monofunctional biosynthetic peptidoglycan transglycosylase
MSPVTRVHSVLGWFGKALLVLAVLVSIIYLAADVPGVNILKSQYPVVVYSGKGQPTTIKIQKERPPGWVSYGEVSRVAVGAIVVSEDWAFFQHKGYDMNQIKEAIREDWESGHFARGASTITQQVIKNVFLQKDKNLWRKLKEFYLATRIEEGVGKRRILEVYLNIAEWGEGIFGIGAASRYYFRKRPSELTAKEGAFLAMLLPSPIRYGQSFRAKRLTEYARETVTSILVKMCQARYLSPIERDAEIQTPLVFELEPVTPAL